MPRPSKLRDSLQVVVAWIVVAMLAGRVFFAARTEAERLGDLGWSGLRSAFECDSQSRRRLSLGSNYEIVATLSQRVTLGSVVVFYAESHRGADYRPRVDRLATNLLAMHHPLFVFQSFDPDEFHARFLEFPRRDIYVVDVTPRHLPPGADSMREIARGEDFVLLLHEAPERAR